MKKVCILSTAHSAFDTRVFKKEAVSLAEAGYDVDYYVPHDEDETVEGVRIVSLSEPRNRLHRMLLSIVMLLTVYNKEYDVYHFHDPELLPVGVVLEKITDASVIYDVHENFKLTILSRSWIWRPLRPVVSTAFDVIEPLLVRQLSGVVVAADDLTTRYEYHDNVVTVGNFPSTDWIEIPATATGCDLRLLFSGCMTRQKPMIPFIKAVGKVDDGLDVQLDIYGYFTDDRTEEVVRALAWGNSDVRFHGWVSQEEVIEASAASDFGIISLTEDHLNGITAAFRSRKLFEYMATGTGVLVPDFGNWPTVVEETGAGLAIDVNDPAVIAEHLEQMARDPEKVETFKENARNSVADRFNWEEQNQTLLTLYNTIGKR